MTNKIYSRPFCPSKPVVVEVVCNEIEVPFLIFSNHTQKVSLMNSNGVESREPLESTYSFTSPTNAHKIKPNFSVSRRNKQRIELQFSSVTYLL